LGEILEGCEVAPLAAEAGVKEEALRRAAEALSGVEGPVLLMGPGVLDPRAAPLFAALSLLLPTARLGYLSAAGNLQGALDMGCLPGRLPGYTSFDGDLQALAETLGFKFPTWPGEDTEAVLEGARAGRIKALYLLGADPLRDYPDFAWVRDALSRLDLLIIQDLLPPRCMEFASAVLPNRAVTETQGSITNLERRAQGLQVAVKPPSGTRADWEIFEGLAKALDVPWNYRGLKEVQEEIARAVPLYRAMAPSDLSGEGFQWSQERRGARLEELLREVREPALAEAPGSSLILLTSPHLFASGPWVAESRAIRSAGPQAFAELHPETARALGVVSGDLVELSSEAGRISAAVKVDGETPPGAVYVPSGVGEEPSSLLQGRSSMWPSVHVKRCP
jgi:predicted molibdopterin-dependent oxidoreductase YjgC